MAAAAHTQTEATAAHVGGQRAALVSNTSLQIRLWQRILRIKEHADFVFSAPSVDSVRRLRRKISAHKHLRPYVVPAILIEKSSLYPPEVHSINLVKRIQRIRKKTTDTRRRTESRWPHRLSARPRGEVEKRGRDRERKASSERGAGSQVRAEIRGQVRKQIILKIPPISTLNDQTLPLPTWRRCSKP